MYVIQYRDHASFGELRVDQVQTESELYGFFREDGGAIDVIHYWEIPGTANLFRLIVAGSRDFNDYPLLCSKLDYLLQRQPYTIIVSGAARGADSLGERYAREHGLPIDQYPADWVNLGKRAGYVRNEQMAKVANACVCFWDGVSPGTKSMIKLARQYNLDTRVIIYKNNLITN
jgi:hypothetical protein